VPAPLAAVLTRDHNTIEVKIRFLRLEHRMAYLKDSYNLKEELLAAFGTTPGCDSFFIDQCLFVLHCPDICLNFFRCGLMPDNEHRGPGLIL
jgi:hypothetical protein